LLVMLADMPCVSPDLLRALLAAGGTAASVYPDGRLGPPACFDADDFPALASARATGVWAHG
jgi:CTP:molybdopterin cytidylyltransferase MocA